LVLAHDPTKDTALSVCSLLQANIYDNEHDVDHVDIMSHFVIDGADSLDKVAAKSLGVSLISK
jgi:hypothetical protein